MTNLLAAYQAGTRPPAAAHDELLDASAAARSAWDLLATDPGLSSPAALAQRQADLTGILVEEGVRAGVADIRDWTLDPLPVILDEQEWQHLAAGLAQRAELLDAILTDLYRERRLLTEGVLPAELVLGHPGFLRAADGIRVPGPHQLFMTGSEIARRDDGTWLVTEIGTDLPRGLGFALTTRRAVSRVLAEGYRHMPIRRVGPFFRTIRDSLGALAPHGAKRPRMAMLVPQPPGLDQLHLADALGLPVVDAGDLHMADGRVWMRSVGDMEPVDVLLRQVDSARSDPVDLYSQSVSGVPGLLEAAHHGAVSVVNPIGSAVLENPALLSYLPAAARTLLSQELLLPSVPTHWCGEREMGSHVIAHLHELVVTCTSTGHQYRGWELSTAERTDLAVRIAAMPHDWVGQEPVELATTPMLGPLGLTPAVTSIRTFTVATAAGFEVLPGGVATTGPLPGRLTGSGHAKDVWVLSATPPDDALEPGLLTGPIPLSAASAGSLFRFGVLLERTEAQLRRQRAAVEDEAALTGLIDAAPEATAAALGRLGRAAQAVREHLTPEAWRTLTMLDEPGAIADRLVAMAAFSGVLAESVVRDDGWRALDMGRRLARSEFLVTSVAAVLVTPADYSLEADRIAALARMHDIALSHRRQSHEHPPLPALLDLLLADRTNPRSLTYSLERFGEDLERLPRPHEASGVVQEQLSSILRELTREIDGAWLAEADSTGRLRHLEDLTESVRWRVGALMSTLDRWSPADAVLWSGGGDDD
ncbi:hypothetical protein GCG21_11260 [Pseudactinotalea sp. HY160]|uniref:circularly permuted type 2 ATP-grasp protein n=1 Tax=Pseudactinotalea sp. HY160 TaxID=2654490 RepID=UPI00128BDD8E|nr:circularly permuted type 2 ATP-grasp protein [Pseudactinotalea sp. HY160]MPV50571.1 hypothetical protein [Pseudactinotalea sp. HY160]